MSDLLWHNWATLSWACVFCTSTPLPCHFVSFINKVSKKVIGEVSWESSNGLLWYFWSVFFCLITFCYRLHVFGGQNYAIYCHGADCYINQLGFSSSNWEAGIDTEKVEDLLYINLDKNMSEINDQPQVNWFHNNAIFQVIHQYASQLHHLSVMASIITGRSPVYSAAFQR